MISGDLQAAFSLESWDTVLELRCPVELSKMTEVFCCTPSNIAATKSHAAPESVREMQCDRGIGFFIVNHFIDFKLKSPHVVSGYCTGQCGYKVALQEENGGSFCACWLSPRERDLFKCSGFTRKRIS